MAEVLDIHQAYYHRLRTREGLATGAALSKTKARFPHAPRPAEIDFEVPLSLLYVPTTDDRLTNNRSGEFGVWQTVALYATSGAIVLLIAVCLLAFFG